MARENLAGIPEFELPPGYSLRWYRTGDEKAWIEIQSPSYGANQITLELFRKAFGADEKELRRRQCYILDANGHAIGTATAWFNDDAKGLLWGRIHWVAIAPPHQGIGLGKALMTTVCERLKAMGHQRAYLTTSTSRVPAINLYLMFGFAPQVDGDEQLEAWRAIESRVKYPLRLI